MLEYREVESMFYGIIECVMHEIIKVECYGSRF